LKGAHERILSSKSSKSSKSDGGRDDSEPEKADDSEAKFKTKSKAKSNPGSKKP
jgi:hypothetical protein